MELPSWILGLLPTVLNGVGVVGGLVFTGLSFRADARARRVANLLTLTANHRQIWSELARSPALARVLDPQADIQRIPISRAEEIFVTVLIHQLSASYRAIREGMLLPPEGLQHDVRSFLALPLPRAVWESLKPMQQGDFVHFVESCLR